MQNYVLCAPGGFLADWDSKRGTVVYTPHIENAALFTSVRVCRDMQTRIQGLAIMTTTGQLLTLAELE